MASFYDEITTQATYALDESVNGARDCGFTPTRYQVVLRSGGPVQYSFDGTNDAGALGPSGTRPMSVDIDGGAKSRVWVKGSGEVVEFRAWDGR
jgi:hypothetical protein